MTFAIYSAHHQNICNVGLDYAFQAEHVLKIFILGDNIKEKSSWAK